MRKRLIEKFKKFGKGSLGFTMTELLAVIAIIAVTCAIAIPSVISISRALNFRQRNDYAKTIFMAAQANLSEMRSDGSLELIYDRADLHNASGNSGFPSEDWADEYVYVTSAAADSEVYALVLPANSVESTLRNEQVIIEFNPYTGNVYSVFYSEARDNIFSVYTGAGLPRADKTARRSMMLGYYEGSGLGTEDLDLELTSAELTYANGEEGVITVRVPMPAKYYGDHANFMEGLQVILSITGDISGNEITIETKTAGNVDNCTLDVDGKTVLVDYVLDSLVDYGSFANKAMAEGQSGHLTQVLSESGFEILPGENITVQAEVQFTDASAMVEVESGILPGINPLFEYMELSAEEGKYVIGIANGRNLQNLNVMAPSVAALVETVVFTDDVYWNKTVEYYNNVYGSGGTYSNTGEAPARCLPYFVPINNQNLFGSAYFSADTTPVIQDRHDATAVRSNKIEPAEHADIMGDDHRVIGLNIDATKYGGNTAFSGGEYYVSNDYTALNGTNVTNYQRVDYLFTGLFAYANTNIDGLKIVNPIVKGHSYASSADVTTCTGALLGASGYNTLVTNCGVYIDKNAYGYASSGLNGPKEYSASAPQTWYGVSGQGSVGGLVGYAKSHRTASGDLTDDTSELAFSYSFAAVPVSGDMRGNENKNYGYTNGVGGFIGNSELTNFYGCYASGDVLATGCYVSNVTRQQGSNSGFKPGRPGGQGGMETSGTSMTSILVYEGWTSMGCGGFAGTSHGTRYTNCFATGDVSGTTARGTAKSTAGVGGFVGIMCYDEGFNYVVTTGGLTATERIEQLTVFDSCYAAGKAKVNSGTTESFSGGNARIYTYSGDFYVDYYKLFAPYYTRYQIAPKYPSTHDTDGNQKNDAYYVYKDSYYLSNPDNTGNSNSNDCASVVGFDVLTNLPGNHRDSEWLQNRVDIIGQYTTARGTKYASYQWRYNNRTYTWQTLTEKYKNELREGFPWLNWEAASAATSHPYNMNSGIYPFSKIKGLEYYGDWPTRPLEGGIAYYEDYEINGVTSRGFYFDSDTTATIMATDELGDHVVVSDGYAILTANESDEVVVRIEGTDISYSLTGDADGTFVPGAEYGNKSFAVFPLTKDILDAAAAAVTEDNFFVKITATVTPRGSSTGATYTMYFNPDVARSHMNPSNGTTASDPGDAVPDQILIRTARQLAALSTASESWGEGYVYVQELDIDCTEYTASSYTTSGAAAEILKAIANAAPIGTAEHPFNATYNGENGTTTQSAIVRDDTAEGEPALFGIIGETGFVKNLILHVDTTDRIGPLGGDYENVGIVANVINGTVDNVDLVIASNIAIEAEKGAGLYAGLLNGTLSETEVVLNHTLTMTAANAGGIVGQIGEKGIASDNSVTYKKLLTLSGTNSGGFAGASAGEAKNITVVLSAGMTVAKDDNQYTGGFAGLITGGSATTVDVTLCGAVQGKEILGGIVGHGEKATLSGLTVKVDSGATLTAETVAGAVGNASELTVQNSAVTINGTLSGTTTAAGFAGTVGKGSNFRNSTVSISGKITAETAVGYAAVVDGSINAASVSLNGAQITGINGAAGFAGNISGIVANSSSVTGRGTIASESTAAGFALTISGNVSGARVTPAQNQTADAYLGKNNDYLKINGSTAAGFVINVAKGGTVINCDCLDSITADTISCFADTNAGSIDGCMANVTISAPGAFVRDNASGTVSYCYGLFEDYSRDTDLDTFYLSGTCYSSYFADIDIPEYAGSGASAAAEDAAEETLAAQATEGNGSTEASVAAESTGNTEGSEEQEAANSAVMYTANKEQVDILISNLRNETVVSELNGADGKWYAGGTFNAYPYSHELAGTGYPFPMHRIHCGNWTLPPQFAYGVIYYEQYQNETLFRVLELSNYNKTEDGIDLSMNMDKADLFPSSGDATVIKAGYALFCEPGGNPLYMDVVGNELADKTIANAINSKSAIDYKVYELVYDDADLNEKGQLVLSGYQGDVVITPWYADTINQEAGPYQIRSAEQLGNIGKLKDSFNQTINIVLDNSFHTVNELSGTFNGGTHSISADSTGTLITTVSGTVNKLNLKATETSAVLIGGVSGTIADSSITVATANSAIVDTVSGVMTGCTVDVTSAKNGVIGTIGEAGKVTGLSLTANETTGAVIGTVSGTLESADNAKTVIKVTTANNVIVDTVSGAVSGCTMDITTAANGVIGIIDQTGAVTGLTLTAKETTGAVIGTVGGTVTNGTITVGTAGGMVVGTVSGTMTGCTVDVTTAESSVIGTVDATVESCGITVGTANSAVIGTVSGTVKSGTVTVTTANANVIGTVAGTVDSETVTVTTAKNSIIGTVSGTVSSNTFTVTQSQASGTVFGVAAAEVTGNGKFTGNTLSGADGNAVALSISGGQNMVIGGLVGTNAGEISGGSANVAISYVQRDNDSAVIGGLVGRMTGGSIADITASGSVNLVAATGQANVTTSGRSYIIGGVIGEDAGASAAVQYSGITASVTVDSDWAGGNDVSGAEDPMGQGPVGMFVGYVANGNFDNCSSAVQANETFQFLGQIAVTSGKLPAPGANKSWFSDDTFSEGATYDKDDGVTADTVLTDFATAEPLGFTARQEGDVYTDCKAEFTNCTFYHSGTQYYQKLAVSEYFFLGEKQTQKGGWKLEEPVGEMGYAKAENVTYTNLYSGSSSTNTNQKTDYYYLQEDGTYAQVYVGVYATGRREKTYTYTLYNESGNELIELDSVKDRSKTISSNGQNVTLYQMAFKLSEGTYLITDTNSDYAFNGAQNGDRISKNSDGFVTNADDLTQWAVDTNSYWKNGDRYLYLNDTSNFVRSNNGQTIWVSKSGTGYSIYGNNRYLTSSGSSFSLSYNAGTLMIWKLSQSADVYLCVFGAAEYTNVNCFAVSVNDSNQILEPVTEAAEPAAAGEEAAETPATEETVPEVATEATTPAVETDGGDTRKRKA